ncbi:RHO1 GDP-GTP exchange protein 2 [Spiromyces aspiralis]|uniref:RHO1 GDP-GTP exchange protein 2 n=1 Tax=Spiromyces aspiralis TaxID=68401 RepID=A0ACC1HR86_9FUNG|nr:RHO1 GDP-GTP exchange protein 2 [Spiromyces aspiralis]
MMVMFGAMDGLYMGLAHKPTSVRRICKLGNVSSVHVFEAFDMVIALTNGRLLAYHLNELEDPDNWGREVRGVQLAANIAYTAAGRYLRRPLLVYARVHRNRTKFKCVQPFNSTESSAHAADAKRGRLYHNKKHRLDVIQEFWIGCETFGVHFFRKKLCVVCRESFEIVDIRRGYENFGLPNPLDPDLRFVQGSGGRPLAIHRIGAEFLLCFEGLAFYLNRAGQRTRLDFIISWLLPPRQVIVHGPYIVAFNQLFIEIRNAGTGELEHTIRAPNAVCLNGNNFPNHGIHVAAPSSSLNHIGSLLMKGEMLTSASESSPSPMSSSAFLPYLGNYMTTMSLHLQGRSSLSHRPSSASLSSSLHGSLVHLSRSQSPSLVSVPANYIVFELRLPSSSP